MSEETPSGEQAIRGIDACFNHWLAVRGGDQPGILRELGLPVSRPASWDMGERLVQALAHRHDLGRLDYAFVTPELDGWTLVLGPRCSFLERAQAERMRLGVERLSAQYGQAQAYFFGSQRDGSAWWIAEQGRTLRRYSELDPGLALGEPLPLEREHLHRLGLREAPEVLHARPRHTWPEALLDFDEGCDALAVARALSLDPVWSLPGDLSVRGGGLLPMTPAGAERGLPALVQEPPGR